MWVKIASKMTVIAGMAQNNCISLCTILDKNRRHANSPRHVRRVKDTSLRDGRTPLRNTHATVQTHRQATVNKQTQKQINYRTKSTGETRTG